MSRIVNRGSRRVRHGKYKAAGCIGISPAAAVEGRAAVPSAGAVVASDPLRKSAPTKHLPFDRPHRRLHGTPAHIANWAAAPWNSVRPSRRYTISTRNGPLHTRHRIMVSSLRVASAWAGDSVGGAMERSDTADTWLDLPPTPLQTRWVLAVTGVVLAGFAAVVPIAGRPLTELNAFFPSLDAIVFVSDLITTVLLYAQFSISRSRALLALATGYLFTALIVIPHALTFAGAFSQTGLLGANIQTGSWLFIFWHIGFSAALLAYAVLSEEWLVTHVSKVRATPAIWWSTAGVIGLVCALTWLATAGAMLLPPIILDQRRISPIVVYPISFAILISLAALLLLLRRRRSVLGLWLMVVALVGTLNWRSAVCYPRSVSAPDFTPDARFRC